MNRDDASLVIYKNSRGEKKDMATQNEGKIKLAKKAGFNKPLGGDTLVQVNGMELSMKEMRDKAIASATDHPDLGGIKVSSLEVGFEPGP